ncbi:gastrula zinc finger protein XlCGF17.1-like [Engraulis encrasicolus]|uniref:gastrula zinc finger protein XlCGF17.1-like n=1 Tax=Engraulis encrasicolus TaxID=184585 RepID=UPI002FD495B9
MAASSLPKQSSAPDRIKAEFEDVPVNSPATGHGTTGPQMKTEPVKDEDDDWDTFMYATSSGDLEGESFHMKRETLSLKYESYSSVSCHSPTHSANTNEQCVQTNGKDLKLNVDHVENDSEQDPIQTDEESMDSAQEPYPSPRKGGKSKPKKVFECEQCGHIFSRKDSFTFHMYIHSGKYPYSCSVCQKTFSRADHLAVHMRYHTGERPFKCDECGEGFVTMRYLREHESTHTGTKPYACEQCDRSFAHRSFLVRHMRNHRTKPFACEHCDMRFSYQNDFVRHNRKHNGQRPYPCSNCYMTFKRLETLQKHVFRKHERISSFSCPSCGKPFKKEGHFRRHVTSICKKNKHE